MMEIHDRCVAQVESEINRADSRFAPSQWDTSLQSLLAGAQTLNQP